MSNSAAVEGSDIDSRVLEQLQATASSARSEKVLQMAVRILRENFDSYNWVGIYLVKGQNLVLAAYAGEAETEHVKIPIGQGICGLAAKQRETIVVADVNKDPRYLMCFPSTRSEIVVPIMLGARVLGEIDIDSDRPSAFSGHDRKFLEQAAKILAGFLGKHPPTFSL